MVTFHASAVTSFLSSVVIVSTFVTDSFSSRVISLGKLNVVLVFFFIPQPLLLWFSVWSEIVRCLIWCKFKTEK